MCSMIPLIALIFAAVVLGASAYNSDELTEEAARRGVDYPFKHPRCPKHATFMLGNACTDFCGKETMRCTSDMTWACYCQGDYRLNSYHPTKKGPFCIHKSKCPKVIGVN